MPWRLKAFCQNKSQLEVEWTGATRRGALAELVAGPIVRHMNDDTDIHDIPREPVTRLVSKIVAETDSEIGAAEGEVQFAIEQVEDFAAMLENAEREAVGWGEKLDLDHDDPDDIEKLDEFTFELADDLKAAKHQVAARQERVDELAALRDKVEQVSEHDGDGWTDLAVEIACVGGPRSDNHSELAELMAKLADTIRRYGPANSGASDGTRLVDENARSRI